MTSEDRGSAGLRLILDTERASTFALEGSAHRLTRDDVSRLVAGLASLLADMGVGGTGRSVLVCAPRGRSSTVVVLLALWHRGLVPALMDASAPADRKARAVDKLQPGAILAFERNEAPETVEVLQDLWSCTVLSPRSDLLTGCPDPAYVAMTSGSTGEPMLALCRWEGLIHVGREWASVAELTPTSRVLQFASPAYDAYYTEVVPTLLGGATLVCPDEDSWGAPSRLATSLGQRRITHVTVPPSVLTRLLATDAMPRLDFLGSAGERLDRDLALRALDSCGRLLNAYGPAEATVCTTTHVVTGTEDEIPIGRPLEGVLVDAVDGLLRISGPTVAWGYVGDSSGALGRFEPATGGRDRSFVPGDLVEDRDGLLFFRGRHDRQAKVFGHRVDLTSIEWHLRRLEGIIDCAVVIHDDRIACLVVSQRAIREIALELRSRLPTAEWPTHWATAPEVPYLTSDKLDVRQVREILDTRWKTGVPGVPADAPDWLVDAWCRHVALLDGELDFFAAGGDSLAAMELLDTVHEACGVDVDIADFLTEPTMVRLLDLMGVDASVTRAGAAPHLVVDDEDVESPRLAEPDEL